MNREIDNRNDIQVVTKNDFIVADGLSKLSLNARKLLYLAIAQCRKSDKEFFEYSTTPSDLAEMWGVSRQRVYQKADEITDELMRMFIKIKPEGKKFKKYNLFKTCEYDDDNLITFEISSDMAKLFLKINGDFTHPPLSSFMRMRSKYSMAIWHLMQREMESKLPSISAPKEFDLTLEELRKVTDTQEKFRQIVQFKTRVLDQAIKEIKENLLADITYTDLKQGKKIIGFRFTAASVFGTIKSEELTLRERQIVRKAQLINKKADGTITTEELIELQKLQEILYQMTIQDYYGEQEWSY